MSMPIKFRGKRVDNGEWVYGSLHYEEVECEKQYFKDGANNHMLGIDVRPVIEVDDDSSSERLSDYVVIPKSVGQFTGLPDRDRSEIFRNDIIDGSYINKMSGELVKRFYLVVFENGCYIAKLIGKSPYGDTQLYFINQKCKVIGNSTDNPSLLEVQP